MEALTSVTVLHDFADPYGVHSYILLVLVYWYFSNKMYNIYYIYICVYSISKPRGYITQM